MRRSSAIWAPRLPFSCAVCSLYDTDFLQQLVLDAGFYKVKSHTATKKLRLPPPATFLWQYLLSTPVAAVVAQMTEKTRAALEHAVLERWVSFVEGDGINLDVNIMTVVAEK
jgi:hypothetical protein